MVTEFIEMFIEFSLMLSLVPKTATVHSLNNDIIEKLILTDNIDYNTRLTWEMYEYWLPNIDKNIETDI